MIQSTPDLHCQHHVPQQLSVAGVIFGEDYLLELALTSGFYQMFYRLESVFFEILFA